MDKKEEAKAPEVNGLPEKEDDTPTVDIMAQQLKFVACLKILMEELSTLATGFEVDGKFYYMINDNVSLLPDRRCPCFVAIHMRVIETTPFLFYFS